MLCIYAGAQIVVERLRGSVTERHVIWGHVDISGYLSRLILEDSRVYIKWYKVLSSSKTLYKIEIKEKEILY